MDGELSYIEIGVENADKGRAFYEALFGWTFDPGPEPGKGFVIDMAGTRGGIHPGDKGATPYVFFKVDDLAAATAKIQELGGTVEDLNVEGDEESQAKHGRFKLCRDDQGSAFGIHEPAK